jgi:hypothetical protein
LPQLPLQSVDGACSSILKAHYLPLNIPVGFKSDLFFLRLKTVKMLRTGTSALHSANKEHEVSSVWSLEYYAATEILLFKDSGNGLLHSRVC